MKQCNIDAVYHGEERYSKLSLAFRSEEERQDIETAISESTKGFSLEPQIYTSDVSNGKKVIVIEFHDDYDREAGVIFDNMLKKLGIESCE
ncbi:MAG: hypothetical protein U9N52_07240 [Campylobacterota bacterium]|nr:hypothetical protein [Campylobacterota bacterium]